MFKAWEQTNLYGAVEKAVVFTDWVHQSLGAVERHAGARVPDISGSVLTTRVNHAADHCTASGTMQ